MSVIYRQPSSLFIDTSTDKATIQHNSVGTASTVGLSILNNTSAALGAPQFSNGLELAGAGWNSAGSASVTNKFMIQTQAISGSYTPTGRQGDGYLIIANSYNGNSYATTASIDGYGNAIIAGLASTTLSVSTTTTVTNTVGWTAATLLNSYSNIGGVWTITAYTKDALGRVHIKGTMGTGGTAQKIFTLPAGFRPGRKLRIVNIVSLSLGIFTIDTNGDVLNIFGSGYSDSVFVENMHFFAEN